MRSPGTPIVLAFVLWLAAGCAAPRETPQRCDDEEASEQASCREEKAKQEEREEQRRQRQRREDFPPTYPPNQGIQVPGSF